MDADSIHGGHRIYVTAILYVVDGYMMNKFRFGDIDTDEIEQEIAALINHWKLIFTEIKNMNKADCILYPVCENKARLQIGKNNIMPKKPNAQAQSR